MEGPIGSTINLATRYRHALRHAAMAVLLLAAGRAEAGAFNEPAGRGLVIVQGRYDTGDTYTDRQGRSVGTSPYLKREGWAYFEYGITDWLMAVVQPDVVSTRVGGSSGGRYTGFGTSAAGLQVQLPSFGPFVLALQGTYHLPGKDQPTNPALVGNTSRDTDARGLAGAVFTLGPWPGFVDLEAGYRVRGGRSPEEVHLDMTGGLRFLPALLVQLQSTTTIPTTGGGRYYPRPTYSNLEGSAVYDLDAHWSLQLGVFGTVFGRDALQERGVSTAVWYRF